MRHAEGASIMLEDPLPLLPDDPAPGAGLGPEGTGPERCGALQAELAAWRAAHPPPPATVAEIEAVVEAHLGRRRAQGIRATLPLSAAPTSPDPSAVPSPCPTCAVPQEAWGIQRPTLRVVGDQPGRRDRTSWTCPHCGDGRFAPGCGARPRARPLLPSPGGAAGAAGHRGVLRAGARAPGLLHRRAPQPGNGPAADRDGRGASGGGRGRCGGAAGGDPPRPAGRSPGPAGERRGGAGAAGRGPVERRHAAHRRHRYHDDAWRWRAPAPHD